MPEPMIAMSHVGGSEAVERRLLYLCGWESQYEVTGSGTGRMRGSIWDCPECIASFSHATST